MRDRMRSGIVADVAPSPWDALAQRIAAEPADVGVLLSMRGGRKIGARLRDATSVVIQATGDELLLDEVWTIDQSCGTFVAAVPGSLGILVHKADCETIEFLRWPAHDPRAEQAATDEIGPT